MCHHSLKQVVDIPTREESILDLIITKLQDLYCKPSIMAPLETSDHSIVKWVSEVNDETTNNKTVKKKVRRFPQSSREVFGRWCSSHIWFTELEETTSASNLAACFTKELNSAIDRIFPTKVVKIHHTDKPWMTPTLKKLINLRQKAFYSGNKDLWHHYRAKVRNDIMLKKRSYYENKVKQLKYSDPKKWWDCINQLSGKKKPTFNNINIVKDGVTLSGMDLAQALNVHFLSVNDDLPNLDPSLLPAYLPAPEPIPSITPEDICAKMLKVKVSKSNGYDNIPNYIIKEFAYELADPVCYIFNTSLATSEFPDIWKDAVITPIPKVLPVSAEDELRPISLTTTLSKILEDFVVKWLIDDVQHKIDPQQFGCLKGTSTTFCLIDMIDNWLKSLDTQSHYLRICFIDFSKAFDRIDHNILVLKLLSLGVRKSIIPWICSFLSNRRQSVKIDNYQSEWGFINAGVPQGTKLGPILFIIMINDLELANLNTAHWKYVDDVTLPETVSIHKSSALPSDLNTIENWTKENNMKLNGKKCKEMIVSFLRNEIDIPRLCIEETPLELVTSFKVLGMTLNNKLKWQDNTLVIVKKASKRLYIIRVLRRCGLSASNLLVVYLSLVRPLLEYACPIWHTMLPTYLSDKIERVQKRAFRIIYPQVDYEDALKIAQCTRLDERHQVICGKTFQKIQDPDSKLNHLLPPFHADMHDRELRNDSHYWIPKCRTERYKNSFIPRMCSIFNSK